MNQQGRPIYAMIDDASRRKAILELALHNFTSKDLMSYHHWGFACEVAIGHVEDLEKRIAVADIARETKDPVNRRTVAELVP